MGRNYDSTPLIAGADFWALLYKIKLRPASLMAYNQAAAVMFRAQQVAQTDSITSCD